ncbi:MAG: CAP domain-containing protein [Thermodesulfobacteriota bacterium]
MIQGIGRVAGLTLLAMVLWTVPEGSCLSVDELIIKYTNQERARAKNRDLKPLMPSKALTYIALKHSIHQARTGVMAHEDKKYPTGWRTTAQRFAKIGLSRSSWAENVFMKYPYGSDDSYARAAVRWWMNSPPHRANILESRMKYIGVGVSQSMSKPGLVGYATQAFASSPGSR